MYLAIDVGGTKTLFAVFDAAGKLVKEHKIPTPPDYDEFLSAVAAVLAGELVSYEFKYCCCALPGRIDQVAGVAIGFGNLPWHAIPFKRDLQHILPSVKIYLENDSKLAGLSEARLLLPKYKKVLYLTISTGINGGLIVNGVIDPVLDDSEMGQLMLEHEGKLQKWETFASGHAIVQRFGKRAADINDKATWHILSKDFAIGMIDLIATLQPDAVVVGGSIGTHFHKYGDMLNHELKKFESDLVPIPPILAAKHAEEAVIYGCYELILQQEG
jgi:predicted NBD/HSP70 family sugar kinase